jgi:hypothetical protein
MKMENHMTLNSYLWAALGVFLVGVFLLYKGVNHAPIHLTACHCPPAMQQEGHLPASDDVAGKDNSQAHGECAGHSHGLAGNGTGEGPQ